MGNWFHLDCNINFDKYGDGRGIITLFDRYFFSTISNNYCFESNVESSVGYTEAKSNTGIVGNYNLMNTLSIKLDCPGEPVDFIDSLKYTLKRIIKYDNNSMGLESFYIKISSLNLYGLFIFDKNKGLMFIDYLSNNEISFIEYE